MVQLVTVGGMFEVQSGGGGGSGAPAGLTPVIDPASLVLTVSVDGPSATFAFTTDVNSGTGVAWGPTAAYGTAAVNAPESVTSHSITINQFDGLPAETDLHGKVAAAVGLGTPGYSADFTFSTKSKQYMVPGYGFYSERQGHPVVVGKTYSYMRHGVLIQESN